jgi:hypothetical protein
LAKQDEDPAFPICLGILGMSWKVVVLATAMVLDPELRKGSKYRSQAEELVSTVIVGFATTR